MSATIHATLEDATAELVQALIPPAEGDAGPWTDRLERALKEVERAALRHGDDLETPEGRLVDVDSPTAPSGTTDRRVGKMREELVAILEEAAALRARVKAAGRFAVADVDALRRRAEEVLASLHRFERAEVGVVQESVNTDIGGGD